MLFAPACLFLTVASAARARPGPAIGGVIEAGSFGGFAAAGPGSWIEIYGTDLAQTTRPWNLADFNSGAAPIALEGVSVSIGGQAAFVSYISPLQVNALVPSAVSGGAQQLTVTNRDGTSAQYSIAVQQTEPGLWVPQSFKIGSKQYVGAIFPDYQTYVLPQGAVPGLLSRAAHAGETIILYGAGFGAVTPAAPAGQIASQPTQLNAAVQFYIGSIPVTATYAGLAPGYTGLYQFNLVVPAIAADGALPVSLTLDGASPNPAQALFLAVSAAPALQITGFTDLAGTPGVAVPGSMLVVQASGFSTVTAAASWPLPTLLQGVSADFGGFAAPIASVNAGQIQLQVPWELLGQSQTTLTVSAPLGEFASISVPLQPAAPAILSSSSGFATAIEGASNPRPAVPGDFLDIPAVGLGIQNNGPPDGQPAGPSLPGDLLRGVMVHIGSAIAPVSSTALIPGRAGVSMIRVQVPANADTGSSVPVAIEAWDRASQPVAIAVGATATPFQIQPADGVFMSTPVTTYPISLVGNTVTNDDVLWTSETMNVPMIAPGTQTGGFGSGASGLYYTGPFNMALPEYMLLIATLKSNPAIFATARVLVTEGAANFHITPRDVVIGPNDTVTFQALDNNGNPVQVSWAIDNGYTNVFQPPPFAVDSNPYIVRAWTEGGVLGGGAADQTEVFVVPAQPHIVSVSPLNPFPGDQVTISTEGLEVRNVTVYFTRLDGSLSPVSGTHGDNQVSVLIPPDAVEGPIQIEAQPVNSVAVSTAPFPVAISPKLRLRPQQIEIAQGETTAIYAAFLFDTRARLLRWSSTLGSIDEHGTFSAPASVSQTVYTRITACLADRNVCGWTVVAVDPFRFQPAQPVVTAGGSLTLQAVANGTNVPVTWQAMTSNITVDASGVVQAASGPLDGGVAQVQAVSASGATRVLQVAVTGSQGGMTTVARDWLDWPSGAAFGAGYASMVAIGNRAYVLSTRMPGENYIPGYEAFWIDTWDITDPANPAWLASTGIPGAETTDSYSLTKIDGGLLVLGPTDLIVGSVDTEGSISLIYKLSNGIPVLSAYQTAPLAPRVDFHQNINGSVAYGISGTGVFRVDYGTLAAPELLPIQLPPAFTNYSPVSIGAVGTDSRLYLSYSNTDPNSATGYSGQIFVYDLTVSPPALLNTAGVTTYNASLKLIGGLLLCGPDVYTLTGDLPHLASQLPMTYIYDTDSTRNFVLGQAKEGMRIADLTDPANPRISAATPFLNFEPGSMALAPGSAFMALNGEMETYSVVWQGGPQYLAAFGGAGIGWDQKAIGDLVFLAESRADFYGETFDPEIFKVYNIANGNPQLVGYYEDPTQDGQALQLSGNYAFLQCTNDLVVLDISNPAAPAKVASVPVGGTALTLSGTKAIIGVFSGNSFGLVTVDISTPTAPVIVGQVSIANPAYVFALNGNTLAVAGGAAGLSLYDVSKPVAPAMIWNDASGTPAWSVAWSGNLLYTASDTQGLVIRDASNPRAPVTLGSNALLNYQFSYDPCCVYVPEASAVYVADGVAWVGTTESYASVFGLDVRNPSQPRVIHLIRYGDTLEGQAVTNIGTAAGYLIVGGGFQSLKTMNLLTVNPPGNAIRPAPPQTTPGDIQPPLQLTGSATPSKTRPQRAGHPAAPFLEHKLKHVPGAIRKKEPRSLPKAH